MIPSWVAAQERNTHAFFEQHILAVAKLIAELDFVTLKVVNTLKLSWSVRYYRRERKIAVVRVWRDERKRDKQLRCGSVIGHRSPSGYRFVY
jgi:hypothetical protein